MVSRLILLNLPILVLAQIEIFLYGEFDGNSSDLAVYFTGENSGIITNIERNTFNLNDNNLKNIIKQFYEKRPDSAYLRSPTPWGDLYKKNGWDQVKRILKPENGRILNVSTETSKVLFQIFENNSTKKATFSAGISRKLPIISKSSWSKEGELSIGENNNYNFRFDIVKNSDVISMSYNSPWGKNINQVQEMLVGSKSPLEVVLDTNQMVYIELMSTIGNVQFEIEYEAHLTGYAVINYESPFKGHHFHSLSLEDCMTETGLSNQNVSREVIDLKFYANATLHVQDNETGEMLVALDL